MAKLLIVVGVLMLPLCLYLQAALSVSQFGAVSNQLHRNYAELVEAGIATDDPSADTTLFRGMKAKLQTPQLVNGSLFVAIAFLQIVAGVYFLPNRQPPATPKPDTLAQIPSSERIAGLPNPQAGYR